MLHRIKKLNDMHEGKWNGLGGKLEPGESPEECAIREVYEESGLRIHSPQLRGFLTFPRFSDDEDWYVFVFVANEFHGELVDSSEGVLQWVDDSKLLNLNLWEGDRYFIPLLNREGYFSAKFEYGDGSLLDHDIITYSGAVNPDRRTNSVAGTYDVQRGQVRSVEERGPI